MQIWVTKWTEEMATENGWDNLKHVAREFIEKDEFPENVWIYDDETYDDSDADLSVIGSVDIVIVEYVRSAYIREVHAGLYKTEIGEWGNRRMLIEVPDNLYLEEVG